MFFCCVVYGSLPRGTGAPGAPDEDDYADQLRRMQMGNNVYDSQGRLSRVGVL